MNNSNFTNETPPILISLKNPVFSGQQFQVDLVPSKESTINLLASTNSFSQLASFEGASENRKYYFIDKTLLIKQILKQFNLYNLYVTGPSRFGKTTNLSMIECFLCGYPRSTARRT